MPFLRPSEVSPRSASRAKNRNRVATSGSEVNTARSSHSTASSAFSLNALLRGSRREPGRGRGQGGRHVRRQFERESLVVPLPAARAFAERVRGAKPEPQLLRVQSMVGLAQGDAQDTQGVPGQLPGTGGHKDSVRAGHRDRCKARDRLVGSEQRDGARNLRVIEGQQTDAGDLRGLGNMEELDAGRDCPADRWLGHAERFRQFRLDTIPAHVSQCESPRTCTVRGPVATGASRLCLSRRSSRTGRRYLPRKTQWHDT